MADRTAQGAELPLGRGNRQGVPAEKGRPTPGSAPSGLYSKSGAVQPRVLRGRVVRAGRDPHAASEGATHGPGMLVHIQRDESMSLGVPSQCLKGSCVATTGLRGETFQESPAKEGQGRPITFSPCFGKELPSLGWESESR